MTKRRKTAPFPGARRISLESIRETGGTSEDPLSARVAKRQSGAEFESVEPPFKNPEKRSVGTILQELSPFIKFGLAIGSFFIFIVLPATLYVANLGSNVDTLKEDVRDVKQRTDELGSDAIRQDERIGYLEKVIGNTNVKTTEKVKKK